MTTEIMRITRPITFSRVEKHGLIVTGILVAINAIVGSSELALGAGVGGGLVLVNFLAIRLVVGALIGGAHSKGFSVFVLMIKMAVLIGLVISLFLLTKINIYGFLIGVAGGVIYFFFESLFGEKEREHCLVYIIWVRLIVSHIGSYFSGSLFNLCWL